jgi:tetratricopeptide (TPR) repeat protein
MSENLENTQPTISVARNGRVRSLLFTGLGLLVILVLAILAGYGSGISIRRSNESANTSQQLGEQFQYALVDIEFGRYPNARQRLEWILSKNPTFPGAQEKLTEVLVLMNQPTPTLTPSLTPTPDFSGAEQAFAQAQQLIVAQDWPGALGTLDQIRKLDPTYKTGQVDGMYYFALRNYGYDLITKQGNLEGGIYHFTLAERFGPLDRDATGLREGARYYLIGASFWELDWEQALFYFDQVYRGWSGLWDGTFTATERFFYASMRYGDQLLEQGDACGAVTQYNNAMALATLDQQAADNYEAAYAACYPPTPTIDLTLSVTPFIPTVETPVVTTQPPPTVEVPTQAPPTEVPTEVPTELPTEAPTQSP